MVSQLPDFDFGLAVGIPHCGLRPVPRETWRLLIQGVSSCLSNVPNIIANQWTTLSAWAKPHPNRMRTSWEEWTQAQQRLRVRL